LSSVYDLLTAIGLSTILALLLATFFVRLPALLQSNQREQEEKKDCAPMLSVIAAVPGESKQRAFFLGPPKGCSDFLDIDVWLEMPRVYVLHDGSIVRLKGDNVEFVFSRGYWADLVHGPRLAVLLLGVIMAGIGVGQGIRKSRRRPC
jgi:hypothetical protein